MHAIDFGFYMHLLMMICGRLLFGNKALACALIHQYSILSKKKYNYEIYTDLSLINYLVNSINIYVSN